ncbi:hypothetical protein AAHS21_26565, partial [Mycobacterium sp. 050272]
DQTGLGHEDTSRSLGCPLCRETSVLYVNESQNLVVDQHGRMIATDTRGNMVRVFTALPAPREVASISQPGGPYGLTYDAVRDRLWVASSGTNEVIGYDMNGPIPVERQRIRTVRDPYTVGVDPTSGRLFVAGVSGGVLQVIDTAP